MGCISLPTAILGGSLISGAGSLFSGASQADAAEQAAQLQAQTAQQAQANSMTEFNKTQKQLKPFEQTGAQAEGALSNLLGLNPGQDPTTSYLGAAFQPTMAQLSATPGYQFSLQQGEQATQNAAAAQGLGQSGAALKGAANYAEGLAGTTYQQQFQNYMSQNQQLYSQLAGLGQTGAGAASNAASIGTSNINAANTALTSGAAASAGGLVGSAAALGGGVASAAGSLGNAGTLLALTGGSGGGLFGGNASATTAQAAQAGLNAGLTLNADGSIS